VTRADAPVLVTGAGGFLGSHVVRQLVANGRRVRGLVRPTTNIEALSDLPVEWFYGDICDSAAVAAAARGCRTMFHCVVDTRAWLRDPAPLYRTNVDGLRNAMEAALAADVERFIMTSTIGTIGISRSGRATEADHFPPDDIPGHYLRSRVEAENLMFRYVEERGLPGIALNVANTYGPGDTAITPHGRILLAAAKGKMPFAIDAGLACVGIEDAARALLLAEDKGAIGERYIISESWVLQKDMFGIAAEQAGQPRSFPVMPIWLLYVLGFGADVWSRITGRDSQLSVEAARLSHILSDMDSTKARRELGWNPGPVEHSIRAAVDFYLKQEARRPAGPETGQMAAVGQKVE